MVERESDCGMHVKDVGPRDAPAVVLLHGQVEASTTFSGLAERLSQSHRVLLPDLPGNGLSPLPDRYSLDVARSEIGVAMSERGIRQAAFVGFSLGGYHALSFALWSPDAVTSLVLLAPVAGLDPDERSAFAGFRDALAAGQPLAAFDDILLQRWFPPAYTKGQPDIVARILKLWHEAPRATLVAEFDAVAKLRDLRSRLGEIRVPTLVRCGRDDGAIPRGSAEAIARAIPNARVELVDGAGHLLLYQDAGPTIASICHHLGAT